MPRESRLDVQDPNILTILRCRSKDDRIFISTSNVTRCDLSRAYFAVLTATLVFDSGLSGFNPVAIPRCDQLIVH